MKILAVGDPHIKINNLDQGQLLMDYVLKVAIDRGIETVLFMGDLLHNHAVKRVEVEDFWVRCFNSFNDHSIHCDVIVGNHDCVGSKEKEHLNSLNIFNYLPNVTVYNEIVDVEKNGIVYTIAPYYSDLDKFVVDTSKTQGKVLFAHQTFTGVQYSNGFYAKDGIDPILIKHDQIISGHIHKAQKIGDKTSYIGTPKWDDMSDANQDKGIWILTFGENNLIVNQEFLSTMTILTPIRKIVIKEGDKLPKLEENANNYVELCGHTKWITKMKNKFKSKAHIRAIPTDRKSAIKKVNNLQLLDFFDDSFTTIDGINKQHIRAYIEEKYARSK